MKFKCIIVDDDPLSRSFLDKFCQRNGQIEVKGMFPDADSALSFLRHNDIDVIFLDVEMPGTNGFSMLDQLELIPKVIIVSGNTDYAFTAFEYTVTDFLKKPVSYERFVKAVDKINDSLKNNTGEYTDKDIVIKSDGQFTRLNYNIILFIESVGDYVKYVTPSRKYIVHGTMKSVEESINKKIFLRVHRSFIVNIHHIHDFRDKTLIISGNAIPVSKTHKAKVTSVLKVLSSGL